MKSFIGSHCIMKHCDDHSEKYTAYQVVDYVGRDHLLIEEAGWVAAINKFEAPEKWVVIQSDKESTHKRSIISITKLIEEHQDNEAWIYFDKNEAKKKLNCLSKNLFCYLHNQEYDDWIDALTRETCDTK